LPFHFHTYTSCCHSILASTKFHFIHF
jgi:hypothetical protein